MALACALAWALNLGSGLGSDFFKIKEHTLSNSKCITIPDWLDGKIPWGGAKEMTRASNGITNYRISRVQFHRAANHKNLLSMKCLP